MMIFVHEDFWPLLYAGRAKAVISTQRYVPHPPFGASAVFSMVEQGPSLQPRQRHEAVIVTRTIMTTWSGVTVQDARDCGFMTVAELLAYLRLIEPSCHDATLVFIAHFVRVIQGEVVG